MISNFFIKVIIFIVVSLFFFIPPTYAQGDLKTLSRKNGKKFSNAVVSIGKGNYDEAKFVITQIMKDHPQHLNLYLTLASMYTKMKYYDSSLVYYQQIMTLDERNKEQYYLVVSKCFAGIGEFDSALSYIRKYNNSPSIEDIYKTTSYDLEKNYLFAISYKNKHALYLDGYVFNLENMGDNINSTYDEYFPMLNFENNEIIFTRRILGISKSNDSKRLSDKEKHQLDLEKSLMANIENEDFFESHLENGEWTKAQPLQGDINSIANEGSSNLSFDEKKLYFTGCNFENSRGSCDIYISELKNDVWRKPKNLSPAINTEFWESQSSITSDGKVIYFASRRPGGFGGSDIYMSFLNERGTRWGEPINLGPDINTHGDEVAPFIHSDNRTLYFASDKLENYGGFDLFVSKRIGKNRWLKPLNLGYPINTIDNESNIFVSSDGKTALFTSDKGTSKGKIDIFKFELRRDLQAKPVYRIKQKLVTKNKKKLRKTDVKLYDVEDNILIAKPDVDKDGNFEIAVNSDKKYLINVNGQRIFYKYDTLHFINPKDISIINENVIELQDLDLGSKLILKNIYFETDSFSLKPQSFFELNNLVETFKYNPKIKILITGHTDNTGDYNYNIELSNKRANSIKEYLVNKSIPSFRVTTLGKGSDVPASTNETEAGRQLNRRIEIEVKSLE